MFFSLMFKDNFCTCGKVEGFVVKNYTRMLQVAFDFCLIIICLNLFDDVYMPVWENIKEMSETDNFLSDASPLTLKLVLFLKDQKQNLTQT